MPDTENALESYVRKRSEPVDYRMRSRTRYNGPFTGRHYELSLRSQNWRGHEWLHSMDLYVPEPPREPLPIFLQVAGNQTFWTDPNWARRLASTTGHGVVVLRNVPNQPLYEGRREDALIAYTFDQFLDTGDTTWPLLLPMTRAVVAGMDAVEALLTEKYDIQSAGYTVGGASKRSWTSWLCAAVDDRVTGLIPMVFDNLRFRKQLQHQLDVWGSYSERLNDYIERELDQKLDSQCGEELLNLTDPYSYRHDLTQPRCIVSATNDRYWPVTANNLYLDDLPGTSRLLLLPNTGHNLQKNQDLLFNTLGYLLQSLRDGPELPDVSSRVTESGSMLAIHLHHETGPVPDNVRIWSAGSDNRDFRDATWTSRKGDLENSQAETHVEPVKTGAPFVGLFAEMVYNSGHQNFSLTTRVSVIQT